MPFTVAEVATRLGAKFTGDGSIVLTGFSAAEGAKAGDLTFAENAEYLACAEKSAASAVLVEGDFSSTTKAVIRVQNARVAFATVLPLFYSQPQFKAGVHPTAVVSSKAQVDLTAHVGPYCVIGDHVKIGPRSVLQGGNHVGADSMLGEDVNLSPNVTLYPQTQIGHRVSIHAGTVIGSDGYGYVFHSGFHHKIPQVGFVVIEDDVEIGSNVTIDRGALGPTVIGKGTKIDNLVQIAHNVVTGEHCIIVSQVGIAGSTKLGNYVTIAGQAGIAGHLKIGDRVILVGRSGVMHDIPDGEKWMGTPAQPDRRTKREWVAIRHLPELLHRVRDLEKKLEEITGQSARPN